MSNSPNQLVQKLWNYCNILRDDGLSYGDYVEQLTYLLFLKMADEQAKPPINKPLPVPNSFGWEALSKLRAEVSANLQRATRLRQSILQMAFVGKLATTRGAT
jgi:type I restriction-modification system DNA methylase subunit